MSKYYGSVGFVETVETSPGVWQEVLVDTRPYYGYIVQNIRRWTNGESVNDDLAVSNKISIVADPYAYDNFRKMRWIEWMNSKWIISDVSVEHPRLVLTLGGLYNG